MHGFFRGLLSEIAYGILGAVLAASLIFGALYIGDSLGIKFLQSQGGIILAAVLGIEFFFLAGLTIAFLTGRI